MEYEESGTGPESWEVESEQHSQECYTFKGYVVFWDPYGKRYLAPYGAAVYVYDDDEFLANGDDFICSGLVREDGYFECSGCAYDFGSKPDPYVYIVPRNSVLEVRDCRVKDQYFRVVLKEFGPQASGEKEVGTKNNPVVIPDIFRAPYWIFRAIYISWVRNLDEMRKANLEDVRVENLKVCYPEAGKFYYDSSERKIYVSDGGAYAISEVAKLFGYALMHRLYEYSSDFPLFGGGGIFGMCYSYSKNTDLAKKLAFIDGFSTAIALFTFDTSIYCFGGEPDKCETDVFLSYIDFEGSTSIRETWSSYIEAKR